MSVKIINPGNPNYPRFTGKSIPKKPQEWLEEAFPGYGRYRSRFTIEQWRFRKAHNRATNRSRRINRRAR